MSHFFANGTYSYKGRYTLNGTIRYEGSNKLGRKHFFPLVTYMECSGAWNAHEEKSSLKHCNQPCPTSH